jgi:hypothetical protein
MPLLDSGELLTAMTGAAKDFLKGEWEDLKDFFLPEMAQLAQRIVSIKLGGFDEDAAAFLMEGQKRLFVTQVTGLLELTFTRAQAVLDAILAAVASVVNAAIGFKLL